MIVNPVKLTIARHELETLLEAAQFRQKGLANSRRYRLLEMAIDTVEDILAREDRDRKARLDPAHPSNCGFDGPGGAE